MKFRRDEPSCRFVTSPHIYRRHIVPSSIHFESTLNYPTTHIIYPKDPFSLRQHGCLQGPYPLRQHGKVLRHLSTSRTSRISRTCSTCSTRLPPSAPRTPPPNLPLPPSPANALPHVVPPSPRPQRKKVAPKTILHNDRQNRPRRRCNHPHLPPYPPRILTHLLRQNALPTRSRPQPHLRPQRLPPRHRQPKRQLYPSHRARAEPAYGAVPWVA